MPDTSIWTPRKHTMNYADMRTRVVDLCRLEGWVDLPAPPDWGGLVNRALAEFSALGEYIWDEHSFTTVAGTAQYSLLDTDTRDWINIHSVAYGSTPSVIERSNPSEQAIISATWWRDTGGTPAYWWLSSPNTMRLHPVPNATVTVYVIGTRAEPVLTADADIPDAYERFHDAVCKIAAAYHGETYATSEAQIAKVRLWRDDGLKAAETCRSALMEGRAITWTRQVQSAPRRTVSL
jgi:hypothetical protein